MGRNRGGGDGVAGGSVPNGSIEESGGIGGGGRGGSSGGPRGGHLEFGLEEKRFVRVCEEVS